MTKKMKIWAVSRGWLDLYEDEEATAVYKDEVDSKGWNPDGILDTFDNKQEAEAFFKAQCKTLERNEKGCEIAVLTECAFEKDAEIEGESDHEYKDLEIAVGQ